LELEILRTINHSASEVSGHFSTVRKKVEKLHQKPSTARLFLFLFFLFWLGGKKSTSEMIV